ncbi:MAG: magnesium transporter [Ottowia sp.]|nr:magnesium transporter [Ottowia sp.]
MPELDDELAVALRHSDEPFDAQAAAEVIRNDLGSETGRSVLHSWFEQAPAVDVADALDELSDDELHAALPLIPAKVQPDVVGYLPLHRQAELAARMPQAALITLLENMSSDERADLFNALPEDREMLLPALAQAEREDIRRLASYAEDSAGAIMNSQYATLTPELTAGQAIEELRRIAPDRETIYNAYVINDQRELIGVTTLRRLILAQPGRRVGDMMETKPISVRVDEDREAAAAKIARYDFIALPVVDAQHRMVGIITADDAMDVLADAATEDFQKSGGSLGGDWPTRMKDATVRLLYQKRVFWLILLVFANIFSGAGIAYFEDLITANVALVFFLPLLIDSGGNAGSQSSTLMVRALATGDVQMRDWAGMLGRELAVAFLLGLTMALAVSGVGLLRGGPAIALVVALTMLVVVIVGSLIGMLLPFLLSHFKADPAAASSPLITTIADGSGILIYFAIASAILPALAAR